MRNKREYTPEELSWAKTLIKPELPEYDEKDHEIAKLRFVLHEIFEEFTEVWCETSEWAQKNRKKHEPVRTLQEVHEKLGKILFDNDGGMNTPDGTEQDVIDRYAKQNHWDDFKRDHLEGYHCGDCTGVPATCTKCFAEQFYGFQTPYEGKQAGSKALAIYLSWMDDQKAAEGDKS